MTKLLFRYKGKHLVVNHLFQDRNIHLSLSCIYVFYDVYYVVLHIDMQSYVLW